MTHRAVTSPFPGAQLYAAPSRRHGRGVFAGRRFRTGEVLERCPILCVSARERALVERTGLRGYLYQRQRGAGAIALGLGSLYNHAADPNAECELVLDDQTLVFRALRDIAKGEEITISYGDESDLWFDAREDRDRTSFNGATRQGRRSQPDRRRST
jgi:SET domain-containing protein